MTTLRSEVRAALLAAGIVVVALVAAAGLIPRVSAEGVDCGSAFVADEDERLELSREASLSVEAYEELADACNDARQSRLLQMAVPAVLAAALIVYAALAEPAEATRKQCPDCAERVQQEARVCKHCGHRFDGVE